MHLSTGVMISRMTSAHRQWMTSRKTSAHRQLLAEKQLNLEDLWRNARMFPWSSGRLDRRGYLSGWVRVVSPSAVTVP